MKLWFERGAWVSKKARPFVESLDPSSVQRIAVVRHAALGDMVLVRPFLVELRRFFPNAEIVLSLVSNYTYGAPEDLVDQVHVIHGNDQKGVSLGEKIGRIRELGPVDILFDLADTNRSRYLCLLTRAKLKVGFPYRGYLRSLLYDAAVWRSDFSFEAVNMLDMLMLFGADPAIPLDFSWPAQNNKIVSDKPYLVYFPFASVEYKCWPKERFGELILQAARSYPEYDHIILGGISANESELDYEYLLADAPNVRLQSALPLDEVIAYLAEAGVVVANDTGIRNLAIAVDTPTVGVFFSTVPYRYWPRYGQHEAVFRATGDLPDIQQVLMAMKNVITPG
jgi:ADP-heptose:LPS heptosyltransferase